MFDWEQGLNFAVALTAYDNEQESILDETYASIVFKSYTWGEQEDGSFMTNIVDIPFHTCSRKELGLEGSTSAFMPIAEGNLKEVSKYQRKFLCVEQDEMYLYGNYNSEKARLLTI